MRTPESLKAIVSALAASSTLASATCWTISASGMFLCKARPIRYSGCRSSCSHSILSDRDVSSSNRAFSEVKNDVLMNIAFPHDNMSQYSPCQWNWCIHCYRLLLFPAKQSYWVNISPNRKGDTCQRAALSAVNTTRIKLIQDMPYTNMHTCSRLGHIISSAHSELDIAWSSRVYHKKTPQAGIGTTVESSDHSITVPESL